MNRSMKTTGSLVAMAIAVAIFSAPTAAVASGEEAAPAVDVCAAMAKVVLEEGGVVPADVAYDYVCSPGVVTVDVTSAEGTVDTFTEQSSIVAEELPSSALDSARAPACSIFGEPTRTIVSELQVNVDACIGYGQENHPQNGSWLRSAKVEWTVYTGYNSVQNQLRVISTEAATGDVWLFGTLTLQKQNGIGIPSDLSSSVFDIRSGNPPVDAAYLTGTTTWGSHAVRLDDLSITDFDYQFSAEGADPTLFTPRFHCDTNANRSFYPNGEEAGL